MELSELRSYLKREYQTKTKLNSSYSKRAFSRDLGLSPTTLNEFLLGRRDLSQKNINKVFGYLNKKKGIACSFCEKKQKEVKSLVAGPRRTFICNECVDTCNDILAKNKKYG